MSRRGTHLSAPFSVILPDKSVVEVVNIDGEVQGAITPDTFSVDTTWDTDKKALFRSSGIYIQSPSAGKLKITADGSGIDDVTIDATLNLLDNATVDADKKLLFRDTGIFIYSQADGKLTISADGGGADDITLSGGVTLTGKLVASVGLQSTATARTVTTDGSSTGTVADGTSHVTVTSDDANKILILPAATPGRRLVIYAGATGFELRTSAPASIGINGGTGSAAESAIGAGKTVYMTCVSATAWVGFQQAADGTLSAVEVAAP